MAIELQTYQDCVQPFLIHHSSIRGRFVRLGPVVDTIINRHDYPEAVSVMLAEMLVIATMLSGNLKGKGTLTIQLKGDGPIKMMVVDATAKGEMRGYAEMAKEVDFSKIPSRSLADMAGKGYLAITLFKGKEPYQGIVDLSGETLVDAMRGYFTNSEQSEVWLTVSVGKRKQVNGEDQWVAGGLMLQHVPQEGGIQPAEGTSALATQAPEDPQEQWSRASVLAQTLKKDEVLDVGLSPQALLYRLYNEDGVWVYDPASMHVGCRCSRDKIANTLSSFPREEIESMMDNDQLVVNCQFCNQSEVFSSQDMNQVYAKLKTKAAKK